MLSFIENTKTFIKKSNIVLKTDIKNVTNIIQDKIKYVDIDRNSEVSFSIVKETGVIPIIASIDIALSIIAQNADNVIYKQNMDTSKNFIIMSEEETRNTMIKIAQDKKKESDRIAQECIDNIYKILINSKFTFENDNARLCANHMYKIDANIHIIKYLEKGGEISNTQTRDFGYHANMHKLVLNILKDYANNIDDSSYNCVIWKEEEREEEEEEEEEQSGEKKEEQSGEEKEEEKERSEEKKEEEQSGEKKEKDERIEEKKEEEKEQIEEKKEEDERIEEKKEEKRKKNAWVKNCIII